MNELYANVDQCQKCDGLGYLPDENGEMIMCDCQRIYEVRRQFLLAEIPNNFYSAELESFELRSKHHREVAAKVGQFVNDFTAKSGRGLTLLGVTGSGKTHIAIGVLKTLIRRGHRGLFVNLVNFYERLRNTYNDKDHGSELDVMNSVKNIDVLALDDVGAKTQSDWASERLYLIVNHRYNYMKPLIITSNCASMDSLTAMIGGRITSRLYEMNGEPIIFPAVDSRVIFRQD